MNYYNIMVLRLHYLETLVFQFVYLLYVLEKIIIQDLKNFGYSVLAGLMGCIITQQMDFVKTLQQRVASNQTIKTILIDNFKEAPTKLFEGGLNRALLSFFTMGIGFISYDKLYKLIC